MTHPSIRPLPASSRHEWLAAGPFREYAHFLLQETRCDLPTLADLVGVSEQFLRRLVTGRSARTRRPLRRLPRAYAARLCAWTPGTLRAELLRRELRRLECGPTETVAT